MLTKRPVTRYLPLCVGVAFLFFFFIALNSVFKSNQQTRSTLAPQIFSRKVSLFSRYHRKCINFEGLEKDDP